MTAAEFLAVALMLATNFDEWLLSDARNALAEAETGASKAFWAELCAEDELRIGVRRVLWFEARPT